MGTEPETGPGHLHQQCWGSVRSWGCREWAQSLRLAPATSISSVGGQLGAGDVGVGAEPETGPGRLHQQCSPPWEEEAGPEQQVS